MAITEQSRVRFYHRSDSGVIRDTNWDLVRQNGHGEMWEPADTVLAGGFNGTGKVITGVDYVDDRSMSGTPLNSNVTYPRTGTAA